MLSSLIMLSLLSVPRVFIPYIDFTKDDLRQQTKRRLNLTRWGFSVCMRVIIQVQSSICCECVATKKASCLWNPRAFHNVALLLNTVAVSQSPWHCAVSVTEDRLWGRISFSPELKTESVLFWLHLWPTRSRSRRGILQGFSSPARYTSAQRVAQSAQLVTRCCFPAPSGVKGSFVVTGVLTPCQAVFWHLQQVIFQCLINSILKTQHALTQRHTHWIHRLNDTHTLYYCTHSQIHSHSFSPSYTQQSPQGKAHLSSLCSCSLITGPLTNSNYPRCHATTRFNQSDKVISLTLQATRKEFFLFAPPPRPPILFTPPPCTLFILFLLSVSVHSLMVTTCTWMTITKSFGLQTR